MSGPMGCRRCSEIGMVEIAWHYDRRGEHVVECRMVPCACDRGEYWQALRTRADSSDSNRQPSKRIHPAPQYAAILRDRPETLAVFIAPTPGQRRADLTEPRLSPEGEAKVRAILAAMPERAAPHHEPREWLD